MSEQGIDEVRVARIADELNKVRERGLENLDLHTHQQPPKVVPELERLAREYAAGQGRLPYGRANEVRVLLRDGLRAYAERVDQAESAAISGLFFDPEDSKQKRSPGQRKYRVEAALGLSRPRRARPSPTAGSPVVSSRFVEWRRGAFGRLAAFLLAFVTEHTPTSPPA